MKIAILGHGRVGGALAEGLLKLGHEVTVAVDTARADSAAELLARVPGLAQAEPKVAIADAELVILAIPFGANSEVLPPLAEVLAKKILVDCTNPVGPGLRHGLDSKQSGAELIQQLLPATRVVKAFSIYGYENIADNAFPGHDIKPVMMFCGADPEAKQAVGGLIGGLGWEPLDVGGLEQALHLEHMTLLWVRMVRMHKHSPHMVWAVLRRP